MRHSWGQIIKVSDADVVSDVTDYLAPSAQDKKGLERF